MPCTLYTDELNRSHGTRLHLGKEKHAIKSVIATALIELESQGSKCLEQQDNVKEDPIIPSFLRRKTLIISLN